MFKAFLGDIFSGKLTRLNFLVYNLLLILLPIGFMFLMIILGKSPFSILHWYWYGDNLLFWIPYFMINLNLITKRFRDMNAGAWTTTIIMIATILLLSEEPSNIFSLILYIILLLYPSVEKNNQNYSKSKITRFLRRFFKFLWILIALILLINLFGSWVKSQPDYYEFLEREKAKEINEKI